MLLAFSINIKRKYRLLKVCYVPATSSTFKAFLLWPLTVLTRQTRLAVRALNQSIFLRCLWLPPEAVFLVMCDPSMNEL
jgi:hypothetical protein